MGCGGECWIGLQCIDKDQYDYEWMDGEDWDYTNWNDGEPNNYLDLDEDCVLMYSNGEWNDNRCDSTSYKPICNPLKVTTPTPTDGIDNPYYFSGPAQMTFADAQSWCEARGSELASIHSDWENAAALEACGSGSVPDCWIGFQCIDNEQYDFEWMDGTAEDYTNWNDNEPNNYLDSDEDCVNMWSTGMWNDVTCESDTFRPLCNGVKVTSVPTKAPVCSDQKNSDDESGDTQSLMDLLPWILLFVSVLFNVMMFISLYQQCSKRKALERRHQMFDDDTTQMVTMSSRSGYNEQGNFQEITSDASVDYVTMAQ